MHRTELLKHFQAMKDRWPAAIVARSEVRTFSGGALCPGTLANEDSRGTGPAESFRIGKRIVYPVDALLRWMEGKAA